MKNPNKNNKASQRGMTLLELTLVILVLMTLIGTSLYFGGNLNDWKKGREASEALRSVYAAQRGFLADNPRRQLNTLTAAELVPYLPNRGSTFPVVEDLDGGLLGYDVQVDPPVLEDGSGATYDPSGKSDDSLWDVGK